MFSATPKEAANEAKLGAVRLRDDMRQTGSEIRDDLEAAAGKAGRKIRSYIDTAGDEFSHAGEVVSTQIRQHPMQSGAMALAAGFVLGLLFRR